MKLQQIDRNEITSSPLTEEQEVNKGKITEASFMGKGCAISQASISMLTEKIKDMPLSEAKNLKKEDILHMLGIPISFVRMKCALLSLKVLQKEVEETQ